MTTVANVYNMPEFDKTYQRTLLVFTGTFALTYLLIDRWGRRKKRKAQKEGRLPPSIGSLPIVGSRPFVPRGKFSHEFFLEKSYEVGDVIRFKAGNIFNAVTLNSYDVIREAFVKQSVDFASRPTYYFNTFLNPQAKGIIESSYDASFRKYHQLSLSILKEFGFGQNVMEMRICAEVEDLILSLREINGQPIDPKRIIASSVLSVISSIAIGDRLRDSHMNDRIATAVDATFKYTEDMFLLEYLHALRFLPSFSSKLQEMIDGKDTLLNLIDEKISECLQTNKAGGKTSSQSSNFTKGMASDQTEESDWTGGVASVKTTRSDSPEGFDKPTQVGVAESFISSFIEREGRAFDREQLKYTVRDFLLAGYETSATTMQWILLTLANRVDVQDRMQKEIDEFVPSGRIPSLEDKDKMPYVEAAILEVMRRRTLIPLSLPRWTIRDATVAGFLIPKDTMVMPNIYGAHMNRKTWDNPEEFRPERFLDPTGTKVVNKERVISFSLGKRSCLGELLARQEIFLFVTGLLQQFHIRPPEGLERVEVKERRTLTLAPTPFQIRFLPRH